MTYRVWDTMWVSVYTSDADGEAGAEECAGHFRRVYKGCVYDTDWRIDTHANWPSTLLLRIPVVLAEFRGQADAMAYRELSGPDRSVTSLGSDQDKAKEQYGKRKLPPA